jgi:hypothetical protein
MVEIFTKGAVLDRLVKVAIRRRNDSHVHGDRLGSTHPFEFALLKESQELSLKLRGDIADLVQEHSTAVGQFHFSLFELVGSGEGAFLMPK